MADTETLRAEIESLIDAALARIDGYSPREQEKLAKKLLTLIDRERRKSAEEALHRFSRVTWSPHEEKAWIVACMNEMFPPPPVGDSPPNL